MQIFIYSLLLSCNKLSAIWVNVVSVSPSTKSVSLHICTDDTSMSNWTKFLVEITEFLDRHSLEVVSELLPPHRQKWQHQSTQNTLEWYLSINNTTFISCLQVLYKQITLNTISSSLSVAGNNVILSKQDR